MTESASGLRRQISTAADLQSVVRTMRAMAAANIAHYQGAVVALGGYDRTIELGLAACLRHGLGSARAAGEPPARPAGAANGVDAIVFGSDQGLVGPFNDTVCDSVVAALTGLPRPAKAWVVGERAAARLAEAGIAVAAAYAVPASVEAVDGLVGRLQVDVETRSGKLERPTLLVFHNRPLDAARYEPASHRLLPLDAAWLAATTARPWPGTALPEVMGTPSTTLRALVREYLFVSLYRACAESLASENASRLAAMQRADKSIGELLETLRAGFARLRQGAIDAELFDVSAGYEALAGASGT